ncbi:META domain-containing protein [Salana multivorans]|uniref:META domain-containing protein n=1 Tax=Salana multivorans TaxID=120377 RepID=A0A3N2D853_9MICO|nr:META domain-containing protein [Salana multivorans]ROR95973.1 META domain-containing protein [Salana multivorans]
MTTALHRAARTSIALVAAIVLLAACASGGDSGTADATGDATESGATTDAPATESAEGADPGIAGSWVLADDPAITLEVTETGQVSGSGGCNTYMTTVTRDEATGDLTFGPAASTRMACEQAVMDAEHAYLTRLETVTRGTVDGASLVLGTSDGDELVFTSAG